MDLSTPPGFITNKESEARSAHVNESGNLRCRSDTRFSCARSQLLRNHHCDSSTAFTMTLVFPEGARRISGTRFTVTLTEGMASFMRELIAPT